MASHGLRKYFMSNAEQYMKSINVKILMGHDIGVSGRYYRPTESEVLEDYLKAVDLLTIDSKQRLEKKVQQLEGQHAQEIELLKTELAQWEPVKKEMTELWRTIERLDSKYKDKEVKARK
jgi:hypothetical protein